MVLKANNGNPAILGVPNFEKYPSKQRLKGSSKDVMVYKKDTTLGQTKEFDAQIQVLDIPNEIKVRV